MNIRIQNDNNTNKQKVIIFMTILTSLFLNHSNRDYGMNISLADVFIILAIFTLVKKGKFVIPSYYFMFFIILSILLVITSVFYSPNKFNFNVNIGSILKDYIKLLASFLFFLLGYNISRLEIMKVNIKWYSVGSMVIGLLGLLMKILNINHLKGLMYYGGSRFRGLMIDPNYYAIIQCTALVYFLRHNSISKSKKLMLYLMTFIFISMSGSKTGMVTLMLYSILIFLEYLMVKKTSYSSILIILIFSIFLVSAIPFLMISVNAILNTISDIFPIFTRIQLLFENFNSAIAQGGSGRNATWKSGLGIIKSSPLIGVGLGSYITINNLMFERGTLAHNTYLQIIAEWGGIMAMIFFGYIFSIITKTILKVKRNNYDSELFITRDIVIILLIGSLAISLNNARMFWMFLGGFVYYSANKELVY